MKILVTLLVLHVPGGREVMINPDEIVTMRQGEHKGEFVHEDVGCLINMSDGKFVSVIESCTEVQGRIAKEQGSRP
jgi:hypothetical protein